MTVQSLPPAHSDLLLDVFEQCRVVSHAHEQLECHRSGGQKAIKASDRQKVETALQKTYKEAVELLLDCWERAVGYGVSDDTLTALMVKYLPVALVQGDGTILWEGGET